ncbi:uncharacterized protein EDB93DRAFT_1245360 [Suillus bovinus]|uniref:uncharacterized protein n=1 Tax=Suillus bovinus TaxID=48563 RepID=UPI001B864593|nr:uncharacterized protein EDB93DRAFT_1245360 [Suillus bovinus]KAG2158791.1 hypothetical protein EDB93DRAFT_1245360 [Suillus bovinus]
MLKVGILRSTGTEQSRRQDSPQRSRDGHAKAQFGQQGHIEFMRNSSNMYGKAALNISSRTYKQMEAAFATTLFFNETFVLPFQGIVKQFNYLRLEEKATSTCCLPELIETLSKEHFGLVESSFVSTFGGLLDVKAEESPVELDMTSPKLLEALSGEGNALDLALQSARFNILEELDIDPQLFSQPQVPFDAQPLSLSCPPATTAIPTATVAEVADTSKAQSHLAVITANAQLQPTMKCKADDIIVISENESEDAGQPRAAACKPPRKIMWHMTTTTGGDTPEVTTSLSTQGISPVTLDHYLKPRSQLPYCKVLSRQPSDASASTQCQLPAVIPSSTPPNPVAVISPAGTTALAPILRPPGMTRSQHFFTIATRIDARAMQISGNTEFHLFMDM